MYIHIAFSVLVLLFGCGIARAEPRVVAVEDPKPFGYFIGDVLERTVLIEVAAGDKLVSSSLPVPGQIKYWLWLRDVGAEPVTRQGRRFIEVRLQYQTFNAPLQPQRLVIPSLRLTFLEAASGHATATVPPFTFISAPLREIVPRQGGNGAETDGALPELMPDARPQHLSTANDRTTMLVSSIIAVLSFGLLAYHRAWWPFGARPRRPLTRAARRIAEQAAAAQRNYDGDAPKSVLQEAYLELHRAFDAVAGRRLLASDRDGFLADHPALASRREEIGRFFDASGALFFAEDAARASSLMPMPSLADLSADLAALERSAP